MSGSADDYFGRDVSGETASRCVDLVRRCAGKFLVQGGGSLPQDQPQSAPHKRRGPKVSLRKGGRK